MHRPDPNTLARFPRPASVLAAFAAATLLAAACVSLQPPRESLPALPALPATPSQTFGELFERVQLEGVFSDSKTFADATPVASPDVILKRYREAAPSSREALARFVNENFHVPAEATPCDACVAAAPPDDTVEKHIAALWSVLIRAPTVPPLYSSLLPVPKAYVVPGGRFREFYYWDSYFTMLGLILDGHEEAARSQVADFSYMIDHYGHIPNGARNYYLTRSQPPFYYLMVGLLSSDPSDSYSKGLDHLRREYAFWMHGSEGLHAGEARDHVVAMPDGTVLNRYWDGSDAPRDESFRPDVLLARSSGRVPAELYRDIRAAAESGWDFSSRWFGDGHTLGTIRTTAIVPIDLNSLLYGLEQAIAEGCAKLQDRTCVEDFSARATRRKAAVQHYLWDPGRGCFADYDWRRQERTQHLSVATLYPLFVGLADPSQAAAVVTITQAELLKQGGVVTTTTHTGEQWDAPNGWPPLQWITIRGFERYGNHDLAHETARRWIATVRRVYAETGKLLEKYDVETVRPGGGGEYPLQDGFGWTNGVTRALLEDYPDLRSGTGKSR